MALSESNRTLRSRNMLMHLPKVGLTGLFSIASYETAFGGYLLPFVRVAQRPPLTFGGGGQLPRGLWRTPAGMPG